jgi:predicted nucleic acid-binding protein
MILIDTSVWIDHLRRGDRALAKLLEENRVLSHPFILGELAMGTWKQREVVLSAIGKLPQATVAENEEVLPFVSAQRLFGLGIGYIDAHLLASVQMTPEALLWTRDKRLSQVARSLSLAFSGE